MKSLANGLPEFGLPPLDPRVEKELKIEYKRNQVIFKTITI